MRRVATNVILTFVLALVSLVTVDITADDASERSDVHDERLNRGGFNGGRTGLLSFIGWMCRGMVAWESR